MRVSAPTLALLAVLASWTLSRGARADEPAPPAMADPGMAEPGMGEPKPVGDAKALKVLSDEDAAPLLEALKKAVKSRTSVEALPAIDGLAGTTHPDFEAALGRLLGHLSIDVAVRAAGAMGERVGPKTGAALWKGWALPINEKRPIARAAILAALGKASVRLDDKQWKEVETLFTRGESEDALLGVARYFEAIAADKRPCKMFAIFLDEPKAGNVADGSNPPASYWEARWKLWHAVKPAVVATLKAITGQEFDTTDDAKAWFRAHTEFGVNSW